MSNYKTLNVSDIAYSIHPCWSKESLNKMIGKFGKEETIKRFSWLLDATEDVITPLIDQFLTDNYVDEKGVKGGRDFWGDL